MKKYIMGVLSFLSFFGFIGCAQQTNENTIVLFSWSDYISPKILEDFTKETGIKVRLEFYKTNEDMLAKLEMTPGYYDLITPSDFMIDRLIKEDRLASLDWSRIPNSQYLIENLRNPPHDPQGEYSLPYAWGTVGILYDKTKIAPEDIGSSSILWKSDYAGRIIMSDSIRETIGTALIKLGYSPNTTNPQEVIEAGKLLKKQQPILMGYMGDTTKTLMSTGEASVALTWSGTATWVLRENPNMDYFLPKEGSTFFLDSFVIPKDSKKKEMAEKLINYFYRPDIAYQTWNLVGFPTPNIQTLKMLPEKEQQDKKRWYPDLLHPKLEPIRDLEPEILKIYHKVWLDLKV